MVAAPKKAPAKAEADPDPAGDGAQRVRYRDSVTGSVVVVDEAAARNLPATFVLEEEPPKK